MAVAGGQQGPPPEPKSRGDLLPGVTLSVLAIGIWILVTAQPEGIEIDGITYLQDAQALLTDWRSTNILHPPLYSLLLAPFLGLPAWGFFSRATLRELHGQQGWIGRATE